MAADVHEALVEAAAEKQGGARELPPRLADVLEQIAAFFDSSVALPAPGLSILLAVWVAGANVYSVFDFFGYLVFRSATVRCGKTQTLRLLAALLRVARLSCACCHSLPAANGSSSSMAGARPHLHCNAPTEQLELSGPR